MSRGEWGGCCQATMPRRASSWQSISSWINCRRSLSDLSISAMTSSGSPPCPRLWKNSCVTGWPFTFVWLLLSLGGRNSSVGSAWARCQQRRGFDPPLGTFSGRREFSLGVNMGSNSIPQNSFGWEYKLRSSLCKHAFHRTDSKDPDVHVLDGWMPATKKHTQHAPSTKTECDYLNGWIKKRSHTVTYAKISPRVVNPRDIAGEREKKNKKQKLLSLCSSLQHYAFLLFCVQNANVIRCCLYTHSTSWYWSHTNVLGR